MKFLEPTTGERLSPSAYLALCKTHFIGNWHYYLAPLVAVILFQTFFRFDVNYTESLPDHVFITVKGWKTGFKHGDYVAYRFPTENPASPFRKGDHMVKVIGGIAGDRVEIMADGQVKLHRTDDTEATKLMGGRSMGIAKPISRAGKPLVASRSGVIPEGAYYVFAPHKDSLDSRYEMVGLVREEDIIGKSFPIF